MLLTTRTASLVVVGRGGSGVARGGGGEGGGVLVAEGAPGLVERPQALHEGPHHRGVARRQTAELLGLREGGRCADASSGACMRARVETRNVESNVSKACYHAQVSSNPW